jgi:hypothetical protein
MAMSVEINDAFNFGISGAVVTTLIRRYLNEGHSLYVDSWYTGSHCYAVKTT